jgi:hypothetical protein
MKSVAVTQRVEVVPTYGERRDCLDQAWAKFLFVRSADPGFDWIFTRDIAGFVTQSAAPIRIWPSTPAN